MDRILSQKMSEISEIGDRENDGEKIKSTPIQEFYQNQSIFITGGTGFLGKVLIEKLLRCCQGIERIYVLLRKKEGQDIQQRLQNLLEDTVFNKVRKTVPNFEKKVFGIAGDISLKNFGLSDADIALIKKDVSIVFHSAATIRFTEPLKVAFATNFRSIVTMLDLCKEMKNLKAFVYISTVYAHCFGNSSIEEKFYNYPIDYKELLLLVNSLSDEVVETITPVLTKPWLNTYFCSKASAENFLADKSKDLPVTIFRPSVVTASAYEPMPGWIDNYNGSTGVLAGIASGVTRTMHCDPKMQILFVPVDFTVNAIIACAWAVDMQVVRRGKNMLIYNFAPARDTPLTFEMVYELSLKYIKRYPSSRAMWYPSVKYNKYKFIYNFYKIFLHLIPAYLIDLWSRIVGKKPRMIKIYEKFHKTCDLLDHICVNEWDVEYENVERLWNKLDPSDQTTFQFTMQGFDWDKYFSTYIKGIRTYLLEDDLNTLGASRIKQNRLFLLNQVLSAALIYLLCYVIWKFWA